MTNWIYGQNLDLVQHLVRMAVGIIAFAVCYTVAFTIARGVRNRRFTQTLAMWSELEN